MAITKASALSGSSFFKPAAHKDAKALLIEPKSIERGVPNTYQGVTNLRDEVTADITVFDAVGRSDELKDVKVTHAGIVNKVSRALGGAVVGIVGMTKPANGGAAYWDLLDVDESIEAVVEKFYDEREAAVKAAAEDTDLSDFE